MAIRLTGYDNTNHKLVGISNLNWDSANNRLGVGTDAPVGALEISVSDVSAGRGFVVTDYGTSAIRYPFRLENKGGDVGLELYSGRDGGYQWLWRTYIDGVTFTKIGTGGNEFTIRNAGTSYTDAKFGFCTVSPNATIDVRGDAIFNEDGGDYDFRVESVNNSKAIFVDAGSDAVALACPTTALADASMNASNITFYVDEATNTLYFKVKYSDGTTVKTGSISLS